MRSHFKLFLGRLMNERRAIDAEFVRFGRQWHRADNRGIVAFGRVNDCFCRDIDNLIIVRANFNPDLRAKIRFFFFLNFLLYSGGMRHKKNEKESPRPGGLL